MSTPSSPQWRYLARRPGSEYLQLYIKGTKLAAWNIYCETEDGETEPGKTPQEVADDYDIPVEAVLEAIAWCKSKPPELRKDFDYDNALAEAYGYNEPNYKYHPQPRRVPPEELERIRRRIYGE